MADLTDILLRQIDKFGPMSIADYMTQCLFHPELGYYTTHIPIGAKGDFITAPEISQMFGEMLGLTIAQAWMDQGQPSRCILAELGPGRGTLMADVLNATKNIAGFHDAVQVTLVETSPVLKDIQQQTLANYSPQWVPDVVALPEDAPLFIVANEFFDCLPIHQFVRTQDGWQEQMVGAENNALGFVIGKNHPIEMMGDGAMGDVRETCPSALAIAQSLARLIDTNGGAALFIDYGYWEQATDSLQALQNHKPVDVFHDCGRSDLTAHVDFKALSIACAKFTNTSALTDQGVFLERLGITARAQSLAAKLSGDALENHITAHRRLTHPQEMGQLFKVLGLTPKTAAPIAGLSA